MSLFVWHLYERFKRLVIGRDGNLFRTGGGNCEASWARPVTSQFYHQTRGWLHIGTRISALMSSNGNGLLVDRSAYHDSTHTDRPTP